MLNKKFSEFLKWLKDHFFFLLLIVVRLGLEKKENKIAKQSQPEKEVDKHESETIF